jgi:hypothetical protein
MSQVRVSIRRWAAVAAIALLAGCGGGGSADVIVISEPAPIAGLGLVLTRIGPQTVQVDWSDDRFVNFFTVRRDGGVLADVRTTTLIDDSVVIDRSYCYSVAGYDRAGNLIAASATACITLFF